MRYRQEDLEKLFSQLNIVDVIGEYVDLKKAGANYKGLCPFHEDKNPSFMVSPLKNIYKCFVCGAGGTPVKFYMEYNKVDFTTAVTELSKKYNIDIKPDSSHLSGKNYDRYYKILEDALEHFKKNIFTNDGREAIEYLLRRKLNPEFVKENSIGYAKNSWEDMHDHLLSKGYSIEEITQLGLIKKGDKGYYDTFRNRVIFPIYSPSGRVVGFGGRTLEDRKDIAKYINSPETPIFTKGNNLYGIKDSGRLIRKKSYSILMEGYMDVLTAHYYGFDVAVAPLGTAFTEEQAQLLKRYTSNVIISFDMDNAGKMAAEKAGVILKKHGFNIRVLEFSGAKDPDEFLKKFGKAEFLKQVKNSKEIFDFLYSRYAKDYDLTDLMSKKNFINCFTDFFHGIDNDLDRSLYLDKLSAQLDLDKSILDGILAKTKKKLPVHWKEEKSSVDLNIGDMDNLEQETVKFLLENSEYYEVLKDKDIGNNFLKKIMGFFSYENKNIIPEIMNGNYLNEEEKSMFLELISSSHVYSDNRSKEDNFREILKSWINREIKDKLEIYRLNKELKRWSELKKLEFKMKNTSLSYVDLIEINKELGKIKY